MTSLKLFIVLFIFCLFSSCSKTIYVSTWQSKEVKADGNIQEWGIPLRYYDNESRLQYSISNDASNLYICLRATDDFSQMKIMRAGMQLWIDTIGKSKQPYGIMFPLPYEGHTGKTAKQEDTSSTGQFQGFDARMIKSRYYKGLNQMNLIGFKPPIGGMTLLKNTTGISVNIDWDSTGSMNYEAIIPFSTFLKESLSLSDSTKLLDITFIIPAVTETLKSGSNGYEIDGENNLFSNGGFKDKSFSNGYGGNYRGAMYDSGAMSVKNKVKVRIKLATKQNTKNINL